MEPPPNYPSYTRDQLADALAHINRERYPANYAALIQEIQKREEQGHSAEPEFEKPPLHPVGIYGIFASLSTLALGAFGLFLGCWGLQFIRIAVAGSSTGFDPLFCCVLGGILLVVAIPCLIPALFYFVRPKK